MKLKKGDVIKCNGSIGIVLDFIQSAWGAERYKVMFCNGEVGYVWDKHVIQIVRGDK